MVALAKDSSTRVVGFDSITAATDKLLKDLKFLKASSWCDIQF